MVGLSEFCSIVLGPQGMGALEGFAGATTLTAQALGATVTKQSGGNARSGAANQRAVDLGIDLS